MKYEQNINSWLYMQAMGFALQELFYENKRYVDVEDLSFQEQEKKVFEYVLHNPFSKPICSGKNSSHTAYSFGYDLQADKTKIVACYREYKVTLKWNEVLNFIKEIIEAEKQMTLLDLLALNT